MKKSKNSKQKQVMKKKPVANKKNIQEEIKEEIKKLKVKIPELKKPAEKVDSEIEEEIEETENAVEDNEFHEFFRPSNRNFSSLLDKIETPSEKLEENVASTPIEKKEETPNLQSYAQSQDYSQGEAKKYQSENTPVSLRREFREGDLPRQELRNQFQQQSDVQDRKENRSLSLEREEKKYKEFRLH
ncbi:MAG: hypothetical protein Q7S06_01075 [Nanoarchaeota archaeon]|nr:hypothetical protein [Nanoarchaeota archaeon]